VSNPVYAALAEMAEQWKADLDGTPAGAGTPALPARVPQEDTGDLQPETYASEKYALLFAFMSLISPEPAVRDDYARRARNLLMHVMNQAALGPAEGAAFRRPGFFTEVSNRARALGEAFPLTVDWIYPYLTASDKVTILPGGPDMADSGGVLQILNHAVALQTVSVSKGSLRFQLRIAAGLGQAVRIEASVDLRQ
jgi:hypothetical protein